jgi:hypothetical protein
VSEIALIMKNMLLLVAVLMLVPVLGHAQAKPTAQWTKERRLVLSDLPAGAREVTLAFPASQPHPGMELAKVCQQMSNEMAVWTPAQDGKSVTITLSREMFPDWGKEDWELFLTRMAGVYLFPG